MAKKKAAPKKTTAPKEKAADKSPPQPAGPALAIDDSAELLGDGANPRRISEEAASGLRNSLRRFGDISGIVFNKQTGELVCGHQRMTQFREEYGDQPIESIDAESGRIYTPDRKHYLNVRVVEWSVAKQRAANVAANNQKIAGEFTDDVSIYLLEVQGELQDEEPGALDDCLLLDLLADGIDTTEPMEMGEHEFPEADISIIKFAFANVEDRDSVAHAVEHAKTVNSFEGAGIDGQAIAYACRCYLKAFQK